MKFSISIPILFAAIATSSVNAFAPLSTSSKINTAATGGAEVGARVMLPLNMVASQEVEVNKRKKTKEVRTSS